MTAGNSFAVLSSGAKSIRSTRMLDILLVEDNPGDVLLVREALLGAEVEFNLHHIADGEEAVRYVHQDGAKSAAVVLLDLNLPKLNGWEVLEELRASPTFAATPVVILSSSNAPADLKRAGSFDRLMYIRKPPSLDEYLSVGHTIRDFIASSS